jgi:hypothetical protein
MMGEKFSTSPKMAEGGMEHKTSQTTPSRLYKLIKLMPFMIDHRLKVA